MFWKGSVFIAGAVIQWLRDELKMIKDSSSSEKMIAGIKDTDGVYLVPAFVGLGAPYWNADARGIITGLTRGRMQRHIVRAALESMAYQTKEVFDLMSRNQGLRLNLWLWTAGPAAIIFLCSFRQICWVFPL